MSSQCATMALQSCGYIPSCILSHYPAFLAVCGVLTSLIVHHTETVFKVIPTFISCANHILFTPNVFDKILIDSGHCISKYVILEFTLFNLLNMFAYLILIDNPMQLSTCTSTSSGMIFLVGKRLFNNNGLFINNKKLSACIIKRLDSFHAAINSDESIIKSLDFVRGTRAYKCFH